MTIIYGAYKHQVIEGHPKDPDIIDVDIDFELLRQRVNYYFEQLRIVNDNRGHVIIIPENSMRSNTVYGHSGGVSYNSWIYIRPIPQLQPPPLIES